MRKLLPVLLLLVGLGIGAAAGFFLKPAPEVVVAAHADPSAAAGHAATPAAGHYAPPVGPTETVRLPNHFVVPVIAQGRVESMVVISLALELSVGHTFRIDTDEARLRAVFLQLLFDHANIGGFNGIFTSGEALLALRRVLREAAQAAVGPAVQDVLIIDLMRQSG